MVTWIRRIFVGLFVLVAACQPAGSERGGTPVPDSSPLATATPATALSGTWTSLVADTCEWSAPTTPPGICFGKRPSGFRVLAMLPYGARWLAWDPTTDNTAYIDAAALDLLLALSPGAPLARTTVFCLDRSVGYRYLELAREASAALIQQARQPGYVYYLRWIESDSYRPEAEAAPPIRVPLPTPTPTVAPTQGARCNPFDLGCRRRAAVASMPQADDNPPDSVSTAIQQLRSLTPPPAAASDLAGCMRKAAEILAAASGEKYLLIATYLDHRPAVLPTVRLDMVKLRFIALQCDDGVECDRLRTQWSLSRDASNLGDDVRFFDPSPDAVPAFD